MKEIVCFGEFLLRFSPDTKGNWLQDHRMPVFIGGAELNVATALATWKLPVSYITALPDNGLTATILDYLRNRGINTDALHISGERIGTYYLQQGSDLKSASVIYDRANSSFSQLRPGMVDWDRVLDKAGWFHLSAITPALNEAIVDVSIEALEMATRKGLVISMDLNYRSKLWKYGKKPEEIMPLLMKYCHVVMGNIWSANSLLGIAVDEDIHEKGNDQAYLEHATRTSHQLMLQYPKCNIMANTFRFDVGSGVKYFSTLDTKGAQFVSPVFTCETVNDRSGTGDCFMAGLIYGIGQQHPMQEVVEFAAAAAFGKFQEYGDATNQTIEMIKRLK